MRWRSAPLAEYASCSISRFSYLCEFLLSPYLVGYPLWYPVTWNPALKCSDTQTHSSLLVYDLGRFLIASLMNAAFLLVASDGAAARVEDDGEMLIG